MVSFIFLGSAASAQFTDNAGIPSEKIRQLDGLCRVWGFLKYYHPKIQSGKIDWDSVLIAATPKVFNARNRGEFNDVINRLIQSAGAVEKLSMPYKYLPKDTSFNNFDYEWIKNEKLFSAENGKLLFAVIENYKPRKNVYIDREINKYYFEDLGSKKIKEYYYVNTYNPDTAHALLALFRYWNVINYFFAYKKITNENWNDVLPEFIPKILRTADTPDFYLAMVNLITKINDCHGFFRNYNYDSIVGLYFIPIGVHLVEGKTIITEIADSLSIITGMKKGDQLIRINDVDVEEKRKQMREYCNCSTDAAVEREINYSIRQCLTNYFTVTFSDSSGVHKTVSFTNREYWNSQAHKQATKMIPDSVGYINLFFVDDMKGIRRAMKHFQNTKAIIFDLRENAWTALLPIGMRLPDRKSVPFANYYEASFTYPASYKFSRDKEWYLGLRFFHKKYKGKVIFLINENVQSTYEWQLMSLLADYKITLIGSNTSGTDGSATSFLIQKNFLAYFTRDAVFFPDGKQTQRVGVKPDIYSVPTIKGIRKGRDEVMDRAIEFINTEK